jgi:hypothetical protein
MRGPSSRLAVVALALALGAAGSRSLGSPSAAGPSPCLAAPGVAHAAGAERSSIGGWQRVASGGGWKQAESERSGSGATGERSCRGDAVRSPRPPAPRASARAPAGVEVHGSVGLLGLGASPANAPPRS